MAKRKRGSGWLQGTYEVQNKDKYTGTKTPRYLSSYELQVFRYLDSHPSIIEWGSETVVVPYFDERIRRKRRYMVDVYMKVKDKDGNIVTYLCEIKPYAQTLQPIKSGRKRQDVFESEMHTYITNRLKWQTAEKFCEDRGWKFIILTEHQIFKRSG